MRVTGGTADSESDSTRVRCSSDVVSLIERQGSDVLRSGLALREKSCHVVQEEHGQGLAGSETENCGDGAMVDADSFADHDGNKRKEGARGEGEINSGGTCAQSKREEGARVQGGAVLSSFATTETNEQMKVGIVVPPEVPHDTRICIEDLVDMEIDQLKKLTKIK